MSTVIGQHAESRAADYLVNQGFEIVARNWKNRWCEIDIVARQEVKLKRFKKETIMHFVEVKFRQTSAHGSGLEYITKIKAHQLKQAALNWIADNNWEGDYRIDVIGIEGVSGRIDFVENAIIG